MIDLSPHNDHRPPSQEISIKILSGLTILVLLATVIVYLPALVPFPAIFLILGNQVFRIVILFISVFLLLHHLSTGTKKLVFASVVILALVSFELMKTIPFLSGNGKSQYNKIIRVESFNIAGAPTSHTTVGSLNRGSVDIACLQEVPVKAIPKLLKYAESIHNYPYNSYCTLFDEAESALVLFSRYPIIHSETFELSPGNNSDYSRQCLKTVIQVDSDTVHVFGVHLEPLKVEGEDISANVRWKRRAAQAKLLAKTVKKLEGKVILMGDFNATPTEPIMKPVFKSLDDSWMKGGRGLGGTWVYDMPLFRIDYIFHKGFTGIKIASALKSTVSDHRAYRVDLIP